MISFQVYSLFVCESIITAGLEGNDVLKVPSSGRLTSVEIQSTRFNLKTLWLLFYQFITERFIGIGEL